MGIIDHISDMFEVTSTRKSKRKPMQTVEIKVKMDCDGCERKVTNAVSSMKGVKSVDVSRKQSRVTVSGNVEPKKVLKKVQNTGKKAEFWPYVEYNLVSYPYAPGVYDKKAPSGYVRDVPQAFQIVPNTPTHTLTSMFSDENPNACSIM
ncbi:heavy metal-associated isoprenylated plant protein 20 [Nicotiana tabacum]|uniref:Heavy metal-associated isoprenylated plant protein 20 n=2 Tax=Nicotiana TaxID=4085 RepID=A0A1S4DRF6_TOBAC|nr:PREDICTED: heavy metal-associated isoprenylated plant protein 26-like [Nicotiana sylvestris]XP_016516010.1 PREDICTED: heavy metal-associated isoprenylated plant protein 20-like [Nicotiana tabacum]